MLKKHLVALNDLWLVFKKCNFPVVNKFGKIYKYPTAKMYTNNLLSEEFILEVSTREGRPLSPLLALSIEPLAERIRKDPKVTGVVVGCGL